MGKNQNAWFGGFKRLIADVSLGDALGLVVGSANKQVHILDIDDVDLDLALSASTYPTLYIHGSASATEYIKMYTDSTNAHIDVVGANLALEVDGVPEVTVTAGNLDLGTNTLWASSLVINSTNVMTFQIGTTDALTIDDAAITLAAGSGVAGQDIYIKTEDGGLGSLAAGGTGAHIFINAGNAGSSIVGTGGVGGNIRITAGTASAGSGAEPEGVGGNIILEPGMLGGSGTAGYVQILGTASWAAAGTCTVAFGGSGGTGVLGPLGLVGSAITGWVHFKTLTGTDAYMPYFQ